VITLRGQTRANLRFGKAYDGTVPTMPNARSMPSNRDFPQVPSDPNALRPRRKLLRADQPAVICAPLAR
jgi:hypothetical protein